MSVGVMLCSQPSKHSYDEVHPASSLWLRYLAITQTMVEPDPLKIRYREALIQAVQAVIKGLRQPSQAVIAELAREYAAEPDQTAFTEMLAAALQQLHEGSIARYRLRRSEYLAWQQART